MQELPNKSAEIIAAGAEAGLTITATTTGGNCRALSVALPNDVEILLTDGDADLPDEDGWVVAIRYSGDDSDVILDRVATTDEVVAAILLPSLEDDDNPREQAIRDGVALGQYEDHKDGCDFGEGRSGHCTC